MRNFHVKLVPIHLCILCAWPLWTCAQEQAKEEKIGPADVVVQSVEPIKLGGGRPWQKVPDFLRDATIYEKETKADNKLQFEVKTDGLVLLAASWNYDGNASGGWFEGRWTDAMLTGEGWTPIGQMIRVNKDNKTDAHLIYRRQVKAGEKFQIHTRKYNAPLLILVSAERTAGVLAAKPISTTQGATTSEPQASKKPRFEFREQPEGNAALVGLRVTLDNNPQSGRSIGSVQAVYEKDGKQFEGKQQGSLGGNLVEIMARPGYAIGGLEASVGETLAGFRVTFMRQTDTGLDPKDAYESRWIGDQTGDSEINIRGTGRFIVGIRGLAAETVRSLEFISAQR